ncbi:MAG: aconitate hydratase [Oscillospiraceae bacterium]|jgi:aconitate hydratase|nr:aconitate hydratase [Oscillospiraceae bacterium]
MGFTITEKIIKSHLTDGDMNIKGSEIGLKIDQTLTQDATGTMAYLQFEAMGVPRVKTERSVAYIDHNTLQTGFENADDHRYIQSVAGKYGVWFSRPGNGICHQIHLERFGKPGKTLIGSDSHTPTGGGLGMLAIGAGGLDVAVAMGGGAYYISMPEIVNIKLTGGLKPFVSAKDVILEVLRILSVKGGVGKVMEYSGDGVKTLSVPERATITNMGAELGATSSIFPSDEITRKFLKAQGREEDYVPLEPDKNAVYDALIEIDLSKLEPMAACPHSPDNVKTIEEIGKIKIDQVCIGSCTNSSLSDMLTVAGILNGNDVHPNVDLSIAPGSKQVFEMLAGNGALADMIESGARILEAACGPCIGMGQSPNSGGVSLRTFNRNFEGRSGTKDAQVYLVSPETAALSAINGYLSNPTDKTDWGNKQVYKVPHPEKFLINDNMIIEPLDEKAAKTAEIKRGPNINEFPKNTPLEDVIRAYALLKVGDNITTDHIMPAGAKILPLRSNIPAISEYCFTVCDETFPKRAKDAKTPDKEGRAGGIIIGGANYGQGSSREHAALAPLYLGIKAVICKSFARIHRQNLINNGIIPLLFKNSEDYDKISQGDDLEILSIGDCIKNQNSAAIIISNLTKGIDIHADGAFSERETEMLLAGGLLNLTGGEGL